MTRKGDDNGHSPTIDAELYRVLIAQAAQVPMWVLLLPVLSLFVGDHVSREHRIGWGVLIALSLLIRWVLARIFRSADLADAALRSRARVLSGILVFTGLAAGLAPVIWFPELLQIERAVITVAFFGWFAAAVVVSLVHPLSAYLFGMALLGPLSVAWAAYGGYPGLLVAIITLMLLFSVRQTVGAAHRAIRDAIRARLREAELSQRLEERGRELESAMGVKSAFLAAASHDLRQPVTSMSLLLSAMQAARDEQAMRAVAEKLDAPLQALEEILSSLLEMSRLESGVVRLDSRACVPAEIVIALEAEYLPRAQAKGLHLRVVGGDFAAFTDPELLKRVLRNLIENALKFTDAGGVSVEASRNGSDMQFVVSDTGRGIPPEAIEHIFDDYFQAENPHRNRGQGLGLGLAIVRRLLDLLGGTVSVVSELGRGTRFSVTVPGAQADAELFPAHATRVRWATSLDVSSMLVVEDDRLIIDAMRTVAESLGIDARFASDAEGALALTALGRFMPEVALVDFGLPGSMDGIATILAMRERLRDCRFLLVTGDTRAEVIGRAAQLGISTLHKPISVERIAEALRAMPKRGSPERGA
ncbi:hybrid sensor histidine kinase/response regulator [Quisquiliibacterium transsilvanicum]|uniref:histidine kinase n=1 Tax=Quisquiliibacterium transsilvanicum TaxID=1549638 RepID=A0A7W8M8A0_9BURK|nr:hybrid sensor histidine kinase/response regulator [Quisquiliibacterium transsilvanicum]MBB5271045.1 signal transduction histidine kinase/ActR/RegA family two-component response regulator [Quisquiliibacterium transsilvanicum]